MEHLQIEEIMDFVSIDQADEASMRLGAKVSSHIIGCEKCLEKVRAFQDIYDEFIRMGKEPEKEDLRMTYVHREKPDLTDWSAEGFKKKTEQH